MRVNIIICLVVFTVGPQFKFGCDSVYDKCMTLFYPYYKGSVCVSRLPFKNFEEQLY